MHAVRRANGIERMITRLPVLHEVNEERGGA